MTADTSFRTTGFRPANYKGPLCCVIGAGPSGVTTVKRLKDNGIAYDCFEASDNVGGNWYYKNPNGMSACYQSLHIDTSKWRFALEDFPVPANWPDYPHHSEVFSYLNDYIDHFDVRKTITFNTKVIGAHRESDGRWTVSTSDGQTRVYDVLIVANGHHWDPRWPDPAYPGKFAGEQIHAHSYNTPFDPIDMLGKRVLIVGAGNSAMDIASELSQRYVAKYLHVSMRHGVWIFGKYRRGKPGDKLMFPVWVPKFLQKRLIKSAFKNIGRMEDFGLPTPDHEPWEAHGSISGEFLQRAGSGDIKARPGITRFEGNTVHFTDGSSNDYDAIVWCTGYKISFPFFDQPEFTADKDNCPPPLYKRMLIPGVPNLIYMGLAQPLPTLVNFAEQQSKLVAAYIKGDYVLPPEAAMHKIIKADEEYYTGHYYRSARHTIQLNFDHYTHKLKKEIAEGIARRRRGSPAAKLVAVARENAA
jgi:cation diffusion facilitator CzcD-associated flavoprotein CzcO